MANFDNSNYPTVGEAYETEQSAITILRQSLPPRWICREMKPDFHVDYFVEVVETGELTGVHLGVQLKGWRPKKNRRKPRYSLKTKHLAYYVDKCLHPVFLVLVDVPEEKAFWIFTQDFASTLKEGWRKQETLTVEFNENAVVANHAEFIAAVKKAEAYTRNLHPGSVKAAIEQTRKILEAKDERVRIAVNFVNGEQNIVIHAKENFPINFKLTTDTPETVAAFREFVEKGTDLKIDAKELEITGTPLFQTFQEGDGKLLIQFGRKVDGHATLSWNDADPSCQIYIPAVFSGGTKFITCEASMKNAPLKIKVSFCPDSWNSKEPFTMEMLLRPQEWQRKSVTTLPYFEPVYGFYKALMAGKPITLRFFIEGNSAGTAQMSELNSQLIERAFAILEVLRQAREISSYFKKDLSVPDMARIQSADFENINELYVVLFADCYVKKVPGLQLSVKFKERTATKLEVNRSGTLAVITQNISYPVFGERFDVGPVEVQFTHMKTIRRGSKTGGTAVFLGNERSKQIVRLASGNEPRQVPESVDA